VPRHDLDAEESAHVLSSQNLVRVAFHDGGGSYLIPLGYVFLNSALFGVADPGRKTEIAQQNSTVSFQVDTSNDTGLWEWRSVTGEGTFEIVGDSQKERALAALQPVIEQAPDWWRREQGPKMASGALIVWKITPTLVSGCEYVPPEEDASHSA
jgi:nitroimidazol reductase NimA-like FMN-containing flavoprotein (pyridoxamine 5'-phosphate oxidase superfamily)